MEKRILNVLPVAFLLFAIMSCKVSNAQDQNGWTSLFDGKSLNGWKQLGGKAEYKIEDGGITGISVANTGNSFLATAAEYEDFIFEVDIKIEDTTSNSGIQTRSHYDASGNGGKGKVFGRQIEIDPSSRAWTAGVYDEARRGWLYPLSLHPEVQNEFKLNEFNHYTIECSGNETKTWLNNKSVAYVIDTIDRKGFIALQVHSVSDASHAGRKVYFKNIRIKTGKFERLPFDKNIFVVNLQPNNISEYEKEEGWKLLFDGKTTKGWKGAKLDRFPEKGWKVENGDLSVIDAEGKESGNGGDIVSTELFSAFDLTFCFKLTTGANSGVKYFVTLSEKTEGSAIGLEYQVLDDSVHPDAKLGIGGNRTLASLYDLIKAEKQKRFLQPIGSWNWGRVVVHPDNRVEHFLNGVKVLEYVRGSKEYRDLVAISKYNKWVDFGEAKEGHILLQDHGDAVSFRSVKIRRL